MTNGLASVISEFGSIQLSERYQSSHWRSLDSILPPPPRDEWEVIAEAARRIVVEIPLDIKPVITSDQSPFFTSRIQLDMIEEAWRITDVLQLCVSCNLHGPSEFWSLGDCSFCRGTGESLIDAEPCEYCEASGKCKSCGDSGHLGWSRAHSIDLPE